MTNQAPDNGADPTAPGGWLPANEPVPVAAAPFDPYRYGAPEHPVPPEYAPPGYIPPLPAQPVATAPSPYLTQTSPYPPYTTPYGAPPPYGPPPPWATQYPQPRTGNGKAIAALVLGIISLLFFWTTVLDLIPVALAIIFGALARGEAKRTGTSRSMATTGLVLGIIGGLLAAMVTVVVYVRIKPCLENYNSGSSEYNSCINSRLHL
jgi:hypothetical protein